MNSYNNFWEVYYCLFVLLIMVCLFFNMNSPGGWPPNILASYSTGYSVLFWCREVPKSPSPRQPTSKVLTNLNNDMLTSPISGHFPEDELQTSY